MAPTRMLTLRPPMASNLAATSSLGSANRPGLVMRMLVNALVIVANHRDDRIGVAGSQVDRNGDVGPRCEQQNVAFAEVHKEVNVEIRKLDNQRAHRVAHLECRRLLRPQTNRHRRVRISMRSASDGNSTASSRSFRRGQRGRLPPSLASRLAEPKVTGQAVEAEPPWVPQPERPYFGRASARRERVVGGNRVRLTAVDVDSEQFAPERVRVLCVPVWITVEGLRRRWPNTGIRPIRNERRCWCGGTSLGRTPERSSRLRCQSWLRNRRSERARVLRGRGCPVAV